MSFVPLSVLTRADQPESHIEGTSSAAPLVRRFQTGSRYYAYDVNTGIIIELNRLTYELIEFYPMPESEADFHAVSAQLDHAYELPEIQAGFAQLKRLAKEFGLFRPISIKRRMLPPDVVRAKTAEISGHLGQLVLSIVEQCNLRCSYCSFSGGYVNTRIHNNSKMEWTTAQRSMDFFLARMRPAKGELTFYGGEPLINYALMKECMSYMRAKDPDVTFGLTTNGTLLTDEVMETFVEFNVRALISLDGPEEQHDKERRFIGGQGSFATIVKNVRRMQSRYPDYYKQRVKFWCTLRPDEDDESALRFFIDNHELFHGHVGFGKVASGHSSYRSTGRQPAPNSKLEQLYLDKVVAGQVHDSEFTILREMFEKPYIRLQYRPKSVAGFGEETHAMGACFPGNYRVFVKADGTFQICEKSNNSLVIGHIDRGFDLERIAEIYETFYNLHNRECRQCWAYRLCPSCYASSTRETGKFEATLNPLYCESVRSKWTSYLSNYCSVVERNAKGFSHADTLVADPIPVLDD